MAEMAERSCGVVLARAHNDSQPVAQLPAELVRDVFDYCVTHDNTGTRFWPSILSVFHRWRSVALSYANLWSYISIAHDFDSTNVGIGTFPRPSLLAIECLKQHIALSQDTMVVAEVYIHSIPECDEKQYLREAVRLLYTQARRFKELCISISHPAAVDMVTPLPSNLEHIDVLSVRFQFYGNTATLFEGHCGLRPTSLTLSGPVHPFFQLVNPERLEYLDLDSPNCETGYFKDLRNVLQTAPAIRRCTLRLEPIKNNMHPVRMLDGARVPSLEQLELWCDFLFLKHVICPPNVLHLRLYPSAYCQLRNLDSESVSILDNFMQECRALQSFTAVWWPWGARTSSSYPNVDSWFAGKFNLVAVMVLSPTIMQINLNTFKPSQTPSLRYLAIRTRFADNNAQEEVELLMEKIGAILDTSPDLRILLRASHNMVQNIALRKFSEKHSALHCHPVWA